MPEKDINNLQNVSYSTLDAFKIPLQSVDSPQDQKETRWHYDNFQQYWGYFNAVPKLKNALLMKAMWDVGKGLTASDNVMVTLNRMNGWGKDTIKDILCNMDVMAGVNGDSFAQIMRDPETGEAVNIRCLNPGNIEPITDGAGVLKRYDQIAPSTGKSFVGKLRNFFFKPKVIATFKPNEMLHFSNNRLADEIHGRSDIEVLEKVILADQQSFENMQKITTFQAKPFIIFKLKTDHMPTVIKIANKIRELRNLGDDMVIPDDKNILSHDVVQVNPSSILIEWRSDLRNEFYRAIGLPQIIPGQGGGGTESDSKVIFKAFEQIVMHRQLNIEEQFFNQVGIKIKLIHPSLMEDMLGTDERKDGVNSEFSTQPADLNPQSSR